LKLKDEMYAIMRQSRNEKQQAVPS